MANNSPPGPDHVKGARKGEETALRHGKEPGRTDKAERNYRDARDSTGINAKHRDPIDPRMPKIPPA